MRWIFWRRKPPFKNEPGKGSLGEPQKITVFIDAEGSKSPVEEVHGVVIPPISSEPARERLSRHRRKTGNAGFQLESGNSPKTAYVISDLLHLPQTLWRGRQKSDAAAARRIAYFTCGEYAGGPEAIRMMAPAVRRALSLSGAAVMSQSRSLPALVRNPKLLSARKEG